MPLTHASRLSFSVRGALPLFVLGAFVMGACGGSSPALNLDAGSSADADLDVAADSSHEAGPVAQDGASADASIDRVQPGADAESGTREAGADAGADDAAVDASDARADSDGGPCVPDCAGAVCGGSDHCGGTCQTGSCDAGQHCVAGGCVCDGQSCATGCCSGNTCEPGTANGACGVAGAACEACAPPQTCGGAGTAQTCGCTTPNCAGQACGAPDGCGGTCSTGTCPTGLECVSGSCTCTASSCTSGCCDGNGCEPGTSPSACGPIGGACAVCSGGTPDCVTGACCIPTTPLATSSWTLSSELVIDIATTTHYECEWLVDSHTYDYVTCDGWISDVFIASGGSAVVGWNLATNAMYTKQWGSNPYSPSIAMAAAQWAVQTTFPGGNLSNLMIE